MDRTDRVEPFSSSLWRQRKTDPPAKDGSPTRFRNSQSTTGFRPRGWELRPDRALTVESIGSDFSRVGSTNLRGEDPGYASRRLRNRVITNGIRLEDCRYCVPQPASWTALPRWRLFEEGDDAEQDHENADRGDLPEPRSVRRHGRTHERRPPKNLEGRHVHRFSEGLANTTGTALMAVITFGRRDVGKWQVTMAVDTSSMEGTPTFASRR